MADANHKARPPVTERSVTIQESWRYQKPARLPFHMRKEPPTFPWMKLSGRWIETAGFEPRQRVRIIVEHQRLVIRRLKCGRGRECGPFLVPTGGLMVRHSPHQLPSIQILQSS
jgi:toxic protein SymE